MGREAIQLRSVGYIFMEVGLWYAWKNWIRIEINGKRMNKNRQEWNGMNKNREETNRINMNREQCIGMNKNRWNG